MPFQKGNQLWVKGVDARKDKQDKIDSFLVTLAMGGMDKYAEIMDNLSDGKELKKCEEQFLDRVDGWREFVKPKRARVDKDGSSDKKVIVISAEKEAEIDDLLDNLD